MLLLNISKIKKKKVKSSPFALNGLAALCLAFYMTCQCLLTPPFSVNGCRYIECYLYSAGVTELSQYVIGKTDTTKYAKVIYFNKVVKNGYTYTFLSNVKSKVWYYNYSESNSPSLDDRAEIAQIEQKGVFIKKISYWDEIGGGGMVLLYLVIISAFIYVFCWIFQMVRDSMKSSKDKNGKTNSDTSQEAP